MYNNHYAGGSSVALMGQQYYGSGGLGSVWDVIKAPFEKVLIPAVKGGLQGLATGNPIGAGAGAVGAVIGANAGGAGPEVQTVDVSAGQLSIVESLRRIATQAAAGAIAEARGYADPIIDAETDRRVKERALEAGTMAFEGAKTIVPLAIGAIVIGSMLKAGRRR